MADGKVVIELIAKDEASRQFIAAAKGMGLSMDQVDKSGKGAAASMGQLQARADSLTSSLERKILAWVSLAGAIYGAQKAITSWYGFISQGVAAIDELNMRIYSTASAMAAMSDKAVPADEAYAQWKQYLEWLRKETNLADREAAASGREIFEAATAFMRKGVVAQTREQIQLIAYFTDEIKNQIAGMAGGAEMTIRQINQEIRALLEGREAMGAQMARLFSQLDPNWKDNLKNAQQTGRVLEYINSILPRIAAKTKDTADTWESVYSSLVNIKDEMLRAAFGEAYRDIVNWGKEIIDQLYQEGELTEKGRRAAEALGRAWEGAKPKIQGVLDYIIDHSDEVIRDLGTVAQAMGIIAGAAARATVSIGGLFTALSELSTNPIFTTLLGFYVGGRYGPMGAAAGAGAGLVYSVGRSGSFGAEMPGGELLTFGMKGPGVSAAPGGPYEAAETFYGPSAGRPAPPVPALKQFPPEAAAGGAAAKAQQAAQQLQSYIQSLYTEMAKAGGSSLAQLDEWYNKQIQNLEKLEGKTGESLEARRLLNEVYYSKLDKLEDDFQSWYVSNLGNKEAALEEAYRKDLEKYQGLKDAQAKVDEVYNQKFAGLYLEQERESLGLLKGYYEQLGELTPLLGEQARWKELALNLEEQLVRNNLERLFLEGKITGEMYDQALALQALVNQYKKFQAQREEWLKMGLGGGWLAAGYDRQEEALTRSARMLMDTVKEAERGLADAFYGAFSLLWGEGGDIGQQIENLGKSFAKKASEGLSAIIFDMFLPKPMFTPVITAGTLNVATINAGVMGSSGGGGTDIFGSIFGGISSFIGGLFGGSGWGPSSSIGIGIGEGSLLGLPVFQHGGSFTVGGPGGTDQSLVAFRATPGERVTVTPSGRRGGDGQIVVNQTYHFAAAEPRSFKETKSQMAAREMQNLRRAWRDL